MKSKKKFAVIDTNVLVSALLSRKNDTATVRLVGRLVNNEITPLINDKILAEYVDVLHRPKFKFPQERIDFVLNAIKSYGKSAERVHTDDPLPDPKDVVFYEVSLSEPTSFLVTGNLKHFPVKPQIVSPAEMLRIMDEE